MANKPQTIVLELTEIDELKAGDIILYELPSCEADEHDMEQRFHKLKENADGELEDAYSNIITKFISSVYRVKVSYDG